MPDPKKLLGSFFGNLITGIGKKKYQDFIASEEERINTKAANRERQDKLLDSALEKFLDPDTPYMERVKWGQFYQQMTGLGPTAGPEGAGTGDFGYALPTPAPVGPGGVTPTPGQQTQPQAEQSTDVYDFLGQATVGEQQDFLQKSAERQKTLAGAEAQTALAESRRADAAATAKGKPTSTTGGDKLELDKLKLQFNQLNAQYDDLAKLIPKDIYGNFSVDQNDPRVQQLQALDTERNRVYNKMYGGDKKLIPGF